MIFYLHYILLTSGLSGVSVLLGVYMKFYSDASQAEIGALLMSFPFSSVIIKPLFCSLADKRQAHRMFLVWSLVVLIVGYLPFILVPFFPDFYSQHRRLAWYLLAASCFIGNNGLAVAWSIGDSLAVNVACKRGQSFSRYRLFGTVSWGIYGFIIGQINEYPGLPKFVPAFVILIVSVVIEILMILVWNKQDFIMYDPEQEKELQDKSAMANGHDQQHPNSKLDDYDWTPSSLGGSLRMSPQVARVLRELVVADVQSIGSKDLESSATQQDQPGTDIPLSTNLPPVPAIVQRPSIDKNMLEIALKEQAALQFEKDKKQEQSSPQIALLRLIIQFDRRLIKYSIFALVIGYLLSSMNFLFISLETVAQTKGINFSNLAGAVLISQATIETLTFLVIPTLMRRFSRTKLLTVVLLILIARYIFYSFFYYTSDISPYWALVGEWGHGIGYALSCTILADVAMLFANHCKFFLPEMRQMGFLRDRGDPETLKAEEDKIKMALRATSQGVFGGLMDGAGMGLGSLACGIMVEVYGYLTLWRSMTLVASAMLVFHIINELLKTKYSDSYKPKAGTKAFEIRSNKA